ncbi:hypothetical protein GGI23_005435, partial [Coemansia sp. RSA 2559]
IARAATAAVRAAGRATITADHVDRGPTVTAMGLCAVPMATHRPAATGMRHT